MSVVINHLYLIQTQEHSGKSGQCPVCRRGPITENDLLEISKKIDGNEQDRASPSADNDMSDNDSSLKLSVKLKALLRHLNQLRQNNIMTEKCVIFSQL